MVADATSWIISSAFILFFLFLPDRNRAIGWLHTVANCPNLVILAISVESKCLVWNLVAPSELTYPLELAANPIAVTKRMKPSVI